MPAIALGAGLVVLAAITVRLQRGFTFVVDEWDILAHHVHGDLLTPYNGHLSIIPILIYQGFARTFGLGSYWPYATVASAVFLAIPVTFFFTHRDQVDRPLLAIAALTIAWSWAAAMNIMYGFLINFDLPILMLIVAWRLIRDDTRRNDLYATAAVAIALATSSVGVVVAFAIIAELVLTRASWRRLLTVAVPSLAWFVWWVNFRDPTKPATFGEKASYGWHVGVAILAGFTLGWKPGAALVAAALAALGAIAWKRWRTVDAHVVAIALALVFFVALSAFSRAGDIALNPPDSTRYVWVGDVLVIAAVVWCVRGRRIPVTAYLAASAVFLVGAIALVGHLRTYRSFVVGYTERTRPFLVGAEAAGPLADPARILPLNLIPVDVGQYRDLVRAAGSPVAGIPFSALGSSPSRRAADVQMMADEHISRTDPGSRPACAVGWRSVSLGDVDGIELRPGSSLLIRAPFGATVRIRRLAETFSTAPDLVVGPGRSASIAPPVDHSRMAWWVRADGTGTVIDRCGP
ncbi:MAG: hypothetical protein JST73_12370 [Actinobacteria bacterium]|nr:hypothetical protein [Actinomycetota bacterium]